MKAVRVVLNPLGVRALLKHPAIAADLERRAQAIANAAGDGFVASVRLGKNRAHASVITDTPDAMVAEAATRALTDSIDAGR